MTTKEKDIIIEAMGTLENLSMGGIGADGPTVEELDDYADKTGGCFEDNADYHTGQRTWRLLEGLVK